MGRRWIWFAGLATVVVAAAVAIGLWPGGRTGDPRPPSPVGGTAPSMGVPADLSALPVVYRNDFSSKAGPAWSVDVISHTPRDQQPFLGQFGNDTVSLAVHSLPPHGLLRLKFKLYIINTWDGVGRHNGGGRIGPDYWSLDLAGGPNLIRTTFSNTHGNGGFAAAAKLQSYPAPIPSPPVPLMTGAAARDSLGYEFRFRGFPQTFPMDAVYPIEVTIPHTQDFVQFEFSGDQLQGLDDEGWGLADVTLEALPADAAPTIDPGRFRWLLDQAAGDDAVKANQAFWELVSGGDATVAFLARSVTTLDVDLYRVRSALTDLEATDPIARQRAEKVLAQCGPAVEPLLRAALGRSPAPGPLAARVGVIGQAIVVRPVAGLRRRQGAVASRVLQIINTPASAALLETLLTAPPADDWETAFAGIYALPAGQNLKYVPPPLLAARDAYWQAQQRHRIALERSNEPIRPMPSQLVITVADQEVDLESRVQPVYWQPIAPQVYGPKPGLTALLTQLGAINRTRSDLTKVVVAAEMENITLPGDWLIRPRLKQADVLAALEPILQDQTNRSIRFRRQTVEEDVIRVRGTYAFKPVLDPHPDGLLVIFAGEVPKAIDWDNPSGNATLQSLLESLSRLYGVRFINDTGGNPPVQWRIQKSVLPNNLHPPVADTRQSVLENLSRQSSLQFVVEKGQSEIISAVEDPAVLGRK